MSASAERPKRISGKPRAGTTSNVTAWAPSFEPRCFRYFTGLNKRRSFTSRHIETSGGRRCTASLISSGIASAAIPSKYSAAHIAVSITLQCSKGFSRVRPISCCSGRFIRQPFMRSPVPAPPQTELSRGWGSRASGADSGLFIPVG